MDENAKKCRYIKTVIFNSTNDLPCIETRVNETIDNIKDNGGNIVSIIPYAFGLSPMNLIYNVIYERHAPLDETKRDKK